MNPLQNNINQQNAARTKRPRERTIRALANMIRDFWCGPAHIYMQDLVKKYGVSLQANTGAGGHSKAYHDQIMGTVTTFLNGAIKAKKLKFKAGGTKSSQVIRFLTEHFHHDKQQKLERKFYELPSHLVFMGRSPTKPLDIRGHGIASFHAAYIGAASIWYRTSSCFCRECVGKLFEVNCTQRLHSGKWIKASRIPQHPSFKSLRDEHNKIKPNPCHCASCD